MRAKEFVFEAPSLTDLLRTAAMPPQPTKNPNAVSKPVSTTGATGSVDAQQAGSSQQAGGGTSTPQDGVNVPQTADQSSTGQQPSANTNQPGQQQPADLSKLPPAQLAKLKGQKLNVPGLGDVTIGNTTPQGIELDTSKTPTLGAKKMTLDLKSLAQR